MSLAELKEKVEAIEKSLKDQPFIVLTSFERNEQKLHLCLTEKFHRVCRKGKVWKSASFLTALKNAEYGFDEQIARSRGGRDGIFLLDRDFQPRNEMMTKIFDRYLDKNDSGVEAIATKLGALVKELKAVRLVSHHMRLLGVLWQDKKDGWLILVDYDNS